MKFINIKIIKKHNVKYLNDFFRKKTLIELNVIPFILIICSYWINKFRNETGQNIKFRTRRRREIY